MLEPACVHSPGRQCVSGRMPQHVDMDRKRQPSGFPSPLNHACNAHPAQRLAALIDEYVGGLGPVCLLLPVQELETVHLIALQVMDAVGAALEPADDDGPLRQVDIIPAQIASLGDPQAVAVDDQPNETVSDQFVKAISMRGMLPDRQVRKYVSARSRRTQWTHTRHPCERVRRMDIVVWLRSLGLGKYEAAFRENEIDETVLPSLTHETLKELGVTAVGHRLKLLDAIGALRNDTVKTPVAQSSATSVSTEDRAERRQVTVMFSDLVGSTALSVRMDPEDLRDEGRVGLQSTYRSPTARSASSSCAWG
jgi:SAM domain (Sterile alpha motif)